MAPAISSPSVASYPSTHLTLGAGIAIFHLATTRVVLCYHTRDNYYFLPKGRKNSGEALERAAEREGFEESGYRNRLLPIVMAHRATEAGRFAAEALWVQMLPLNARVQYLLFWFVGETVPRAVEEGYGGRAAREVVYVPPGSFPEGTTLKERIAQDPLDDGGVYEPVRHEGMAQDEEEECYRSYLLPVDEACCKLRGTVMEDVVRRGWEGIQARMKIEEEDEAKAAG